MLDNKESLNHFIFKSSSLIHSLIKQQHTLLYLSFLVTHFPVHMDNNFVSPYFHTQHTHFDIFHYMLQLTIQAKVNSLFQQFLLIMFLHFYLWRGKVSSSCGFLMTSFGCLKWCFWDGVRMDLSNWVILLLFIIIKVQVLRVLLWLYDHFLKLMGENRPNFIFMIMCWHRGINIIQMLIFI